MEGMVFDHLLRLLEPCPPEEFFASSWGKSYRHVAGWKGKFAPLLPWDQLNTILRQHRLDFPRLRLVRDGKSLPPSAYLKHVTGSRGRTQIPRLLPVKLTEQLRRGATLVLDAVHELHQPLEQLAEELERAVHERIQINAYAGWRTSRGFDLHWDDHDVFILQVTGRKRWSVYGTTRPYPLARDVEPNRKPTGDPLWDATLEDGDLLYIPRGWWHVAFPLDEPTLHLTVGIHRRTGLDLLKWLADGLRSSESFRMDLPRLGDASARAAHVERLRTELLAHWNDADLLERYFADEDGLAETRAHFSLPWSATPDVLPPSHHARVHLLAPRPIDLKSTGDIIELVCQGKRWQFASAAMLILAPLACGRAVSIKELCDAAEERLDEPTVRAFLRELIRHGLVALVDEKRQLQP